MPKIDAISFTPFLVGLGVPLFVGCVWVCCSGPLFGGWFFGGVSFLASGVGRFETSTESLILAQDERWRRA